MSRPRPRSFASDGQSNDNPADRTQKRSASERRGSSRNNAASDGTGVKALEAGAGATKAGQGKSVDSGGPFASKPGLPGFGSTNSNRSKATGLATSGSQQRGTNRGGKSAPTKGSQVIPEAVAQRMLRRIAIATGVPSVLGMSVFVGSYLLVSRRILDIPPVATLLASGACFLLGLVGLSYGVLSASWEDTPGTLLGTEQLGVNISRVRTSLRAIRQGGASPPSS